VLACLHVEHAPVVADAFFLHVPAGHGGSCPLSSVKGESHRLGSSARGLVLG